MESTHKKGLKVLFGIIGVVLFFPLYVFLLDIDIAQACASYFLMAPVVMFAYFFYQVSGKTWALICGVLYYLLPIILIGMSYALELRNCHYAASIFYEARLFSLFIPYVMLFLYPLISDAILKIKNKCPN